MKLREGMYVREKREDWGQKLTHCRTFKIVIEGRSQYGTGLHSYGAIQVGIPNFVKARVQEMCGSVMVNDNFVEEIDQFEGMLLEVASVSKN